MDERVCSLVVLLDDLLERYRESRIVSVRERLDIQYAYHLGKLEELGVPLLSRKYRRRYMSEFSESVIYHS